MKRLQAGEVGLDPWGVLAMGDQPQANLREDRIQHLGIVHQHIARGGPHENLDPAGEQRVHREQLGKVVVGGADVEAVVRVTSALRAPVFVKQGCAVERGRLGVGHLEEARDAAGHRGARFALEIALVGQSRLAEVHLVVDHSW